MGGLLFGVPVLAVTVAAAAGCGWWIARRTAAVAPEDGVEHPAELRRGMFDSVIITRRRRGSGVAAGACLLARQLTPHAPHLTQSGWPRRPSADTPPCSSIDRACPAPTPLQLVQVPLAPKLVLRPSWLMMTTIRLSRPPLLPRAAVTVASPWSHLPGLMMSSAAGSARPTSQTQ